MNDAQTCSNTCLNTSNCTAFTWHDLDQPKGSESWDGQCYGLTPGHNFGTVSQTHHVSGKKIISPARNIYVAHGVDAPPDIAGLRINGKRAIRARWPNGDPE